MNSTCVQIIRTDNLAEDQQLLQARTAPSGTNNRLSYESTATTNSNPRSRSTEVTESTATAYTDLDLRDPKASARATTAYPDHQGRDLNESEYPRTGLRNSKNLELGYQMSRMPFEETTSTTSTATAYPEYQGQYPNSAEPKYMNSRVLSWTTVKQGHVIRQLLNSSPVLLLHGLHCAIRPLRHH
jgi:hypothetical protein